MKCRITFLAFALLAAAVALGQNGSVNTAQSDSSRIFGVWRGQMGGLPGVTMVVTDEGGSLTGAVLFYFHFRKTVTDPWTSTPGLPEPMFGLRMDTDTLHFEVSHRRAHPPGTLNDRPVHFHLRLTGSDKAELANENENESGPPIAMVRTEY